MSCGLLPQSILFNDVWENYFHTTIRAALAEGQMSNMQTPLNIRSKDKYIKYEIRFWSQQSSTIMLLRLFTNKHILNQIWLCHHLFQGHSEITSQTHIVKPSYTMLHAKAQCNWTFDPKAHIKTFRDYCHINSFEITFDLVLEGQGKTYDHHYSKHGSTDIQKAIYQGPW